MVIEKKTHHDLVVCTSATENKINKNKTNILNVPDFLGGSRLVIGCHWCGGTVGWVIEASIHDQLYPAANKDPQLPFVKSSDGCWKCFRYSAVKVENTSSQLAP